MATTESSASVNGTYSQQSYDNTSTTDNSTFTPSQASATQSTQPAAASEIPKDEVGWYFVEQYYTTLSKTPERLHLFYNKRSQYVSGVEEDKVNVCSGQKAINGRIKELEFKDTKVRVTNVDSQGSDTNIVIQVIGEISNKGQPHKRFVQTFVLAEQTNGFFVLNDIFRYLAEEPEEEAPQHELDAPDSNTQELTSTEATEHAETTSRSEEHTSTEDDLSKVDHKLDDVASEESAQKDTTSATSVDESAQDIEQSETAEAPATKSEETAIKDPENFTAADPTEPEKPGASAPSPAPNATKASPVAMPAGPTKPAAPRTWASLAASAHKVATPIVTAAAAQQVPVQTKSTTSTQAATNTPAQTSAPARDASPSLRQGEAAGWQSVTAHKKEQSRAVNQGPAPDADQKRAYIKNVSSQVEEGALRTALSKFGEIEYFDISRPKNCAFVDFKTLAGFQAVVAANPHAVNGVDLKVEERRQRPDSQFRGGFSRGGAPRVRGGIGGQAPRGGFQPRGRGGSIARGGRGAPQEP